MNRYQLMNKSKIVLEFSCSRDEFDEPVFTEGAWKSDVRPIGFSNIESFLNRRKAPKHRAHIQSLLAQFGCDDIEGFIGVTHAASLNDTFWVREKGSSVKWKDVSLYRNDFNDLIGRAAFDGVLLGDDLSSTSPEFTTDGGYAKCWVREGKDIVLYKTGSPHFEIEPLSEFLATQLSTKLCVKPVEYDLAFHHDQLISKCKLFTDEKFGFAPVSRFFISKPSVSELLRFYEELGSGDDFRRMCALDALIFNSDRHLGNFGVIFDNNTMEPLRMAPLFDHNRSLFYNIDDDAFVNFSYHVRNTSPRFGNDFNITASQLLTPEIVSDLKNLSGFHFDQHSYISAPQKRLDLLSEFVNIQIDLILGRVPVRVGLQQDKYKLNGFDVKKIEAEEKVPIDDQIETASSQVSNLQEGKGCNRER